MTTLQQRFGAGEGAFLEYTLKIKPIDRIAQHLCAFLNSESGGTILCGVDDKGTPVGIDLAPAFVEELQLKLSTLVSPPALFVVATEEVDDKTIIVIEAAAGADNPYVTGGAVWLREDDKTFAADAAALRALFAANAGDLERWERRLSASMRADDLVDREVLALRDEAKRTSRFDFSGEESAEEVLMRLGMTRPGGFTQAADILFSSYPALRHPQTRVQIAQFEQDEASANYGDFRSFEGPAMKVADEVTAALFNNLKVQSSFRADDMERHDAPNYARFALREGVVNAIVHRDYDSYSGSVKISIFPRRIEIWNTGRLPEGIKPEDLGRGHPSILVNPDISFAFFLRSYMERLGRGGQRLAEECKAIGARPPVWKEVHGGVLLILFAAVGKDRARQELLNDRQREYVEAVPAGEVLTVMQYRERFAPLVTERQARRDLGELETYRFARREGVGKSTGYRRAND